MSSVEANIFPVFRNSIASSWLYQVASKTLESVVNSGSWQFHLVIADNKTVKRLNALYRGRDEVTDVLAFSDQYPGSWEGLTKPNEVPISDLTFIMPPGDNINIGEVVIALPRARRQARTAKHALQMEIAILLIHGILHVLGYDHKLRKDTEIMRKKESEILFHLL